ncbi:hypothetical protein IJG72_02920 [bacterium]|nr:hypothetical protein [bacterium]
MHNDDKVINLFSKKHSELTEEELEQINFFEKFHYVKINKDKNNKKFNADHLKKYAQKCHYIVCVMREINGEVWIYNYDVKSEELIKFIGKFNNKTNGTIIEIDKYFPEGLA